jgi:hypothetical protein
VKDIMADPDMPGYSTYFRWQNQFPEFRRAVALAREICALRLAEEGWEDACAVTPATAFATRVKLEHLRWYAGKLAPRRYGALKAMEADLGGAARGKVLHVYTKKFGGDENDGEGRWREAPARHVSSSMETPDGEWVSLPPPAAVREPRSTWGPDARGEARGGAIEVEDEADDYWTSPDYAPGTDDDWT